jgi:hypothetical protein
MAASTNNVVSQIKEWLSPFLISAIGMLLWRDLTELRQDVKNLLYQQSANEIKIAELEKDVDFLKSEFYNSYKDKQKVIGIPNQSSDNEGNQSGSTNRLVALRSDPPSIEKEKNKKK